MTDKPDASSELRELEKPDLVTPAYVLRELADWIELRTGGDEPQDQARIELGRSVADSLDELTAQLAATTQIAADTLIGVDVVGPDQAGVQVYQVSDLTPADPVEAHECSTLEFEREVSTNTLKVCCNLGRCTDINLKELGQMLAKSQDMTMLIDIARRVAAEHGLNMQDLYYKMRGHSLGDLKTITLRESSD